MKQILLLLLITISMNSMAQYEHQRIYSTFDNIELTKADTFNNGSDRSSGFIHMDRRFPNSYDTLWGSWSGWAISNRTDDTTPGYQNQYSAITGIGVSHTANYVVGYNNTYVRFDEPTELSGAYFTNSTYAYLDMLEGSDFSKKFGGDDGNDPDYFKLTVFSYLNGVLQDSAGLFLADFRSSDNAEDYILDQWVYLDFNDTTTDVLADSLAFVITSSDVGQWGINTPQYFCMDDLNAVGPRRFAAYQQNSSLANDTFYNGSDMAGGFLIDYLFLPNSYNSMWDSWSGWAASTMYDRNTAGYENQYSAMANKLEPSKHRSSVNYHLVSYGQENSLRAPAYENLHGFPYLYKLAPDGPWPLTLGITNSAYAYYDMKDGSDFSKKFGGVDGNDPDYFRLIIRFVNSNDSTVGTDTVYLADFRSSNNAEDYILDEWTYVSLSDQGWTQDITQMKFALESSDNGAWGMNTPAYFCMTTNYLIGNSNIISKPSVQISLYPNPAREYIVLSSDANIQQVNLYSMQGELILSTQTTEIDISRMTAGLYIAEVITDKGIGTTKFVKQ